MPSEDDAFWEEYQARNPSEIGLTKRRKTRIMLAAAPPTDGRESLEPGIEDIGAVLRCAAEHLETGGLTECGEALVLAQWLILRAKSDQAIRQSAPAKKAEPLTPEDVDEWNKWKLRASTPSSRPIGLLPVGD